MLVSIVTCVGCSHKTMQGKPASGGPGAIYTETHIVPSPCNTLAEITADNIKVYWEQKSDDMYCNIKVSVNDKVKDTDWKAVSNREVGLFHQDINGDNKKEIIVITHLGGGTGAGVQEIHILDDETLNEIPVQKAVDAIEKQVQSSITDESIQLLLNGNKIEIKKSELPDTNFFKQVSFKSIQHYSMKNNEIIAENGVQVSPTVFIGNIISKYEFKDNSFQVKSMEFIKASS